MEEIRPHPRTLPETEKGVLEEIGYHRHSLHISPFCGDMYDFWHKDGITHLVMADGLGHGNLAEIAALAALNHIRNNTDKDFADLFRGCDAAIRHTRGVAMGVARIDEKTGLLRYAGIGNTRAMICSQEKMTRLTSNFGIVGGGFRKLFIEEKQLLPNDLVIMFTDGLHERANITAYDAEGDLMALAYRIFQDYHIVRDDAAIMIYRMT